VWAYVTADNTHPKLFERVANQIVDTDSLDKFEPQELQDAVWAYMPPLAILIVIYL
jgi:hypothetical protein